MYEIIWVAKVPGLKFLPLFYKHYPKKNLCFLEELWIQKLVPHAIFKYEENAYSWDPIQNAYCTLHTVSLKLNYAEVKHQDRTIKTMAGHVPTFSNRFVISFSNRQKKIQVVVSFKGKNGTFVSFTVFPVYFKVTVINDINLINCVNYFFNSRFVKSLTAEPLTVVCSINGVIRIPKLKKCP